MSASQLVNTITPLFTGYLVPKLGAARCGLMATGAVFGGQLLVVLAQKSGVEGSVGGMVRTMHLSLSTPRKLTSARRSLGSSFAGWVSRLLLLSCVLLSLPEAEYQR